MFHHFCESEIDLKNNYTSWKDVYMEKKNEIEKIRNKFVYKFNKNKKYGDEWDHLQEQVKEYIQKWMK